MMRLPVLIATTLFTTSLFAAGHDLTPPPSAMQVRPVVTGNGSGFMTAWVELGAGRSTLVSQAVSAGGEPIEAARTASDQPPVWSMAIAHSPSDSLVVWIAEGNVYAHRLLPSGVPQNTIVLTPAKAFAADVAVAWNGSRYFVIWSNGAQLVGAFIAPDGSSTAPRPFFGEPSNASRDAALPDIAWDGRHFIVVFAERPNYTCLFTCPGYDPDRFRVMRLSADGDAIDNSPAIITGSHLRAHVASASSQESLVVLDSVREVSTIVVHTDGNLTLDSETPLFRWFSEVTSAVVWNGATYTAGWRYAGADASWIGAAHLTRSGLPFDYRVTAAGTLRSAWWGQPSIAVNEAGVTAFVISEAAGPLSLDRSRLYLASELSAMPAPPAAPRNAVGYFGGSTARIDWQSDPAAGFVIELWAGFDDTWHLYRTVPGDARTITTYTSVGSLFRIRAFGPGGLSAGAITSIGSMQRRRAAGR